MSKQNNLDKVRAVLSNSSMALNKREIESKTGLSWTEVWDAIDLGILRKQIIEKPKGCYMLANQHPLMI